MNNLNGWPLSKKSWFLFGIGPYRVKPTWVLEMVISWRKATAFSLIVFKIFGQLRGEARLHHGYR